MPDDLCLTGTVHLDPLLASRPAAEVKRWLHAEIVDLYNTMASEVEPWQRRVRKAEEPKP